MEGSVLVTGGAGYIGSHVVAALARGGTRAVILDDLSNSSRGVVDRLAEITGTEVPFVEADVRDVRALHATFAAHPIVAVVHCAGLKAVGESAERPLAYWDVNVGGTLALASALLGMTGGAHAQAKLKVGMMLPFTGTYAALGTAIDNGFKLYVQEQGGKLGGRELNFSSDIDLIFCFPEEGQTEKGISNHEYFVRLGQALIRVLNESTADGFVFRVDMRLRPNGTSGPLALSFDAMEHYYQTHGREWERYALLKARVVAGDGKAGASTTVRAAESAGARP